MSAILLFSFASRADTQPPRYPDPNDTDHDCSGVSSLARFPFATVAEYAGRKNVSREYWKGAGSLSAHKDNTIRICFDKNALALDGRFSQGTISIAATLSDRAIEVDGYSEVGKPQTTRSAAFSADLKALVESNKELGTIAREIAEDTPDDPSLVERARNVSLLLDSLLGARQNAAALGRVLNVSLVLVERQRNQLKAALTEYDSTTKALDNERERVAPIARQAADDAYKAQAAVEAFARDLSRAHDRRKAIDDTTVDAESRRKKLDEEIAKLEDDLEQAERQFTIRDEAARKAAIDARAAEFQLGGDVSNAISLVRRALSGLLDTLRLRTDINAYSDDILRYAGGVEDAEIFLAKQGAKAGDILRIYLLHYKDSTGAESAVGEATLKPEEHTLAEIRIDDYGYHRSVLDSFLLVKRLEEPADASPTEPSENDSTTTSPSNFKGTGGASLLWSKTARPHETKLWRIFNPSWGINVSYLDFDTTKEIEIGAGIVAGFFENQLHIGCGWNLNTSENRDYCFVGFSFAAIEKKLTGESDVAGNP